MDENSKSKIFKIEKTVKLPVKKIGKCSLRQQTSNFKTGRWNKLEHSAFIQSFLKNGHNWKKVIRK